MTIELRVVNEAELGEWKAAIDRAYGWAPWAPEREALWREVIELNRSLGLWESGRVVGTATTHSFGLSVPGGAVVPAAGLAWVTVAATHRRQGLLRRMMRRALDDYRAAGEPLAILTASQPAIYGRFGFGSAAPSMSFEIDTARVTVAAPSGADQLTLRDADPADEMELRRCEALYAQLLPTRPGMPRYTPGWDRMRVLDPPRERGGTSPLRCVLAERDGELVGYTRYATKLRSGPGGMDGTVFVRDLDAIDPAAYGALARFLTEIDLMATVSLRHRPVDDPLPHLASDERRCQPRLRDWLHVRPVSLDAALAARTYATAVDVVLDVEDDFCPWNTGRWRLSGDSQGAVCERTDDSADLALPVRALSAAYLGGTSLAALAAAGLVTEHRRGALTAAASAFSTPLAPWLPVGF